MSPIFPHLTHPPPSPGPQERWAEQKADGSEHAEVVTMCCAIKPMASWLFERVVTTCRERCGGAGYLACNRFGEMMGSAHAAMTADGDNSVLMQKVRWGGGGGGEGDVTK